MITFRLPRPGIRLFQPNKILVLLWLFLLVFPKGGFKIAGVPITWGYLALGLISAFSIFRKSFICQTRRFEAYLFTLPFQIICALSFVINGIDNIPFGISFVISFFFFPWLFFICLSNAIESMNLDFFLKLFRKGIFFIAIYGIFLFFFKLYTGKFIEIPFLTMNFHDLGEMETKHIDRGSVFKLISTYNNGIIYGVCLLMLFPLYQDIEKSIWRKILVVISLILTLSRTVWFGLIFSTILTSILASRRISLLKLVIATTFSFFAILVVGYCLGWGPSSFFDAGLGGRIDQVETLETVSILPNQPLYGITEMVYPWILSNFGILGLIGYLICMGSPFIMIASRKSLSFINKNILCGLANFFFVSISDGALLFIPVLVFYWFLSSLSFRNNWKNSENFY